MKGSLRYRLFFLALLLLLGICLLNPSLFYTYLVDPLTRAAWLIIRTFLVVDQEVYWVLIIFAAFLLILRILPARPEKLLRSSYSEPSLPEDRVGYWETLLRSAEDKPDARSTLEKELADLNQSIQTLVEGADPQAVDLPPIRRTAWQRPLALLRSVRKAGKQPETILEKRVTSILKILENKLERNND